MIHLIWLFLLGTGILAAAWLGRLDEVSTAALTGAREAVQVCIGLLGSMALWMGLMRLTEEAGLLQRFAKLLHPLLGKLFPDVPAQHRAHRYIASNVVANFFGLGNAATPSGLKAMHALQELNPDRSTASPAMCTLLALNTSGLTLVPTLLLGLRAQHGSLDPTSIIGPTLLATCISTTAALLLDRGCRNFYGSPPPPKGKRPPAVPAPPRSPAR